MTSPPESELRSSSSESALPFLAVRYNSSVQPPVSLPGSPMAMHSAASSASAATSGACSTSSSTAVASAISSRLSPASSACSSIRSTSPATSATSLHHNHNQHQHHLQKYKNGKKQGSSSSGATTLGTTASWLDTLRHPSSLCLGAGRFTRYIKFLFVLYIVVSLVYTMTHFYALFAASTGQDAGVHKEHADGYMADARAVVSKFVFHQSSDITETTAAAPPEDYNPWRGISDDLLYSKLFQYALKPTRILPYYLSMTHTVDYDQDITITTLITVERLHVFNNLVNKYQGPISVTLHIQEGNEVELALEQLQELRQSNSLFAQFVDVHLVVDRHDRQFNLWRNIARFFARTNLVMTTDVDFMLCTDLRANFQQLSPDFQQMVQTGKSVFVVPAFEYGREAAEFDVQEYPAVKEDLLEQVQTGDIVMFHNKWKRGHGPTQYDKWMTATEPYKVIDYNYNYEPYVLMKKDGLPWCDERFVGYGSNKAACLYEIYLSGAEFWVLPSDFLIHQRHPYPENDRRVERKYNKRLFDAYREETCFRYSRMSAGVPNTTAIDERICGSNLSNFFGL